ncbi:MAG TPA: hypothetical protein VGG72_09500 [Bryobacteraceae bacterium]|jgi:hypothetical protein
MKTDNPFDRKIEIWKNRIPTELSGAAIFVTDTLDLCKAAAEAVFEEKATPEITLAIYDRIMLRMASNPEPLRD